MTGNGPPLRCLRCVEEMECLGVRKIRARRAAGGLLARLAGLFAARSIELETWVCGSCGKVEFFAPKGERQDVFDLLREEGRV